MPAMPNREGTLIDEKNISTLLSNLGYQLLPTKMDLTAEEMMQNIRKFASLPEHSERDSCVVVVLTHDILFGVDGIGVYLHDFVSALNAINAPHLAGKPKLFILQACRGMKYDYGSIRYVDNIDNNTSQQKASNSTLFNFQTLFSCMGVGGTRQNTSNLRAIMNQRYNEERFVEQGVVIENSKLHVLRENENFTVLSATIDLIRIYSFLAPFNPNKQRCSNRIQIKDPQNADILIAYATTPNFVSWRNSAHGAWFIQSICQVFKEYAATEDIITMLTRVNKQVAEVYKSSSQEAKQIPETVTRLRKRFYFFPRINTEDLTRHTSKTF